MDQKNLNKLAEQLIDKEKWPGFLRRFIDVLRINICVVDCSGQILIPPYGDGGAGRYGSRFLTTSFGFDFSSEGANLLNDFEPHGSYLEIKDPFDFRVFAVPVKVDDSRVIAYLLVGPVILHKKWNNDDYVNLARQLHLNIFDLLDMIHEIREVSFVTIKAILDLLSEVVKDVVQLNFETQQLQKSVVSEEVLPKKITIEAKDLYAKIHFEELLVTVLDVALNLTNAECGSIMIMDKEKGELSIKASRGIDEAQVRSVRLKVGQGIAGLAAKENRAFVFSGTTERGSKDNRLKKLLNRPEIVESAVIPLSSKNRVVGVLNLHTKERKGVISENVQNLKSLSHLISTAIHSL